MSQRHYSSRFLGVKNSHELTDDHQPVLAQSKIAASSRLLSRIDFDVFHECETQRAHREPANLFLQKSRRTFLDKGEKLGLVYRDDVLRYKTSFFNDLRRGVGE